MIAPSKVRCCAHSKTVLLDGITPVAAYATLRAALASPSFLLESAPAPEECARHSIMGLGVLGELKAQSDTITLQTPAGISTYPRAGVLDAARQLLRDCAPPDYARSRFLGAYGIAGFELAGYFEQLGQLSAEENAAPELHLIVPRALVVFDHFTHLVTASILSANPGDDLTADSVVALLRNPQLAEIGPPRLISGPVAGDSALDYQRRVSQAKEAIAAGEAFQIVLSQAWHVRSASDPLDVYRSLRSINPSPYMFFLDFGWGSVLGSSPEALCRLDGRRAQVRPLAGTRPRAIDRERERQLTAELLHDPKERAEHLMLVDLARNDLGRVCDYGSVEATDLFTVERYSHVMHLASEVQGTLRADRDAFDLFAATFPAGTVSGAPKIRAMQIIAALEQKRRGWYGGSVAYFGFDGSVDACITLRSAFASGDTYTVRAGAGIVIDSQPELEAAECEAKASAVLRALGTLPGERR